MLILLVLLTKNLLMQNGGEVTLGENKEAIYNVIQLKALSCHEKKRNLCFTLQLAMILKDLEKDYLQYSRFQ